MILTLLCLAMCCGSQTRAPLKVSRTSSPQPPRGVGFHVPSRFEKRAAGLAGHASANQRPTLVVPSPLGGERVRVRGATCGLNLHRPRIIGLRCLAASINFISASYFAPASRNFSAARSGSRLRLVLSFFLNDTHFSFIFLSRWSSSPGGRTPSLIIFLFLKTVFCQCPAVLKNKIAPRRRPRAGPRRSWRRTPGC